MFNSQTTNNQHQVKFEPTVKLAVYTVDYPIYSQSSEQSESRDRRSIRHSNIAFIPHHDRITIQNCENLKMNTSTGTDFVCTVDTVPSQHLYIFSYTFSYIFRTKSRRQKTVRWTETRIRHRDEVLVMAGIGE